jgi:hypothetical protein
MSQFANRQGFLEWGPINSTVPIFEDMPDAKSLARCGCQGLLVNKDGPGDIELVK